MEVCGCDSQVSCDLMDSPDTVRMHGQGHGVGSALGTGGLHAILMGHMHATWRSPIRTCFFLVCYSYLEFTWMAIVVGVWLINLKRCRKICLEIAWNT
jgi:hypothetical protein